MVRRPPRSPRNATLFPYPTLCRSWLRARPRAAAIVRLFDERLHAANTPVERVAAMSELLRRAARRRDPAADRLQGDAWLAFLDGDRASDVARPFSEGSEEHTSELQSLMRISYAVFCLKKNNDKESIRHDSDERL